MFLYQKSVLVIKFSIVCVLNVCYCGTSHTKRPNAARKAFLQDFIEILKHSLQNFYEIFKKCFLDRYNDVSITYSPVVELLSYTVLATLNEKEFSVPE